MGGQLPDSVAQQHAEPERPKAALLGSRAASRRGARLAWASWAYQWNHHRLIAADEVMS